MQTPRQGASHMPAAPPQTPAQPAQLAQQPEWRANPLASEVPEQPAEPQKWQSHPLPNKVPRQAEQQHADEANRAGGSQQWPANPDASDGEESEQDFLAWQMQQTPQRFDKEAPMPSLELQSMGWDGDRGSVESTQQPHRRRLRSSLGLALQALPTPRPSVQQEDCFFWLLEEMAVGAADPWQKVQVALELGCAEDPRYLVALPAQR